MEDMKLGFVLDKLKNIATAFKPLLVGAGIITAISVALALASAHYHRFETAAKKAAEAVNEANQVFAAA
jgi:hypothetical protein